MLMHYDALHQLIRLEQFNEDGKALSTTAYRYDAFGRRLSKTHRATVQEPPQTQKPAQTDYFGWDGDRLVHTEDAALIRHTVYEPDSFVPLLQLQQCKGKKSAAETLWSMGQDDGSEDCSKDVSEDGQKPHHLGASMPFVDLPRAQRELLQGALDLMMQPGNKAVQGLPVNAETASLLAQSVAALKVAHDETVKATWSLFGIT